MGAKRKTEGWFGRVGLEIPITVTTLKSLPYRNVLKTKNMLRAAVVNWTEP